MVRLGITTSVIVMAAAASAVLARRWVSAGMAGLSITYASKIGGSMFEFVAALSSVEASMNAVERLQGYLELKPEAAVLLASDPAAEQWPSRGEILLDDVVMAYRPVRSPCVPSMISTAP